MEKKIYLPHFAIKQLNDGRSGVWDKKLEVSEKPSNYFSVRYVYNPENEDDNEGIDPVNNGFFDPALTDPDCTAERLVRVDASEIRKSMRAEKELITEKKQSLVGKYPDAVYRCFLGVSDAECWARYNNGKIEVFSQHIYQFSGLGHVPSFTIRQEECLDRVLTEGAGLALNRTEVKLCDGSYDSGGRFPSKDSRFSYTKDDVVSLDGKTYKLFQDHDGGARGFALFTVRPKNRIKVLYEDHCDNVRDWMLAEDLAFLGKLGFGVNFKFLSRHNHEFYEAKYTPALKDFELDFHIDEKGRKKRA